MTTGIPIPLLVFIAVLVSVACFAILAWRANRKRRQAIADLATAHDLRYELDDHGQLAPYRHFKLFSRGRAQRSSNHLIGADDGRGLTVIAADYRYRTGSGKNSSTHHQTICIVAHDRVDLPRCLLRRQVALFDALGKFFGGTDFDFDDDPSFSKRYVLQGDNEELVRQAFAPGVRAWCLQQDANLQVECQGNAILVHYGRTLTAEAIPDLLRCASTLMSHWLKAPWLKPAATDQQAPAADQNP